jgi:hypothetical protein
VSVQVIDGLRMKSLDPRFDLRRHSPDGFQWGYGGSGPAQLALALCADVWGNDVVAQVIYQRFKFRWVSCQVADLWTATEEELLAIMRPLVEQERDRIIARMEAEQDDLS